MENRSIREIDAFGLAAWRKGGLSYPNWSPSAQSQTSDFGDFLLLRYAQKTSDLARVISWPAGANMAHYLDGSGTRKDEPLGPIVENDEPALKDILFQDLVDAVTFAQGLDSSNSIASNQWTDFTFETLKWFYAEGTTRWAGDGNFTLDSNTNERQVTVTYHQWDPYDFTDTDAFAGPLLTDSDWLHLHRVGLAKEFLITGKTASITLKWCGDLNMSFDESEIDFKNGVTITIDD